MAKAQQPSADTLAAVRQNIAVTRAIAELLGKLGVAHDEAICAMLTAITVIIETAYRPEQRLEALNDFLAPTIEEWLADRRPVTVQ